MNRKQLLFVVLIVAVLAMVLVPGLASAGEPSVNVMQETDEATPKPLEPTPKPLLKQPTPVPTKPPTGS